MIRIFLSHSSRDHEIVEPIQAQAQAIEVDVYLHELHPEPGGSLSAKVSLAIQKSDALVVLITPNTIPSPYVNQEIGYALGQGLPVIPLVSPGVTGDQLAMLEGTEYIAFDPDRPHEALTHLTAHLHRMQVEKSAKAESVQSAEFQVSLRRQQDMTIALVFVCAALLLYIAASSGGAKPA